MRAYRLLIRLYPRRFRDDFGDDLCQLFEDLVEERGRVGAWRISSIDLLVTLPRMHMERIMNPNQTTRAIYLSIVLLTITGMAGILTDLFPLALLLVVAVGVAVAQRSALSKAIRVPDAHLRRRRLRMSALLGATFIACYIVYLATIGDSWTARETVLALFGTACMIGAAAFLLAGLLTPRAHSQS